MEVSFGKKLKQARLTAHLSIPQLAALLHINKRRLQHIELNEVSYDNLTPEFLTDVAIVLSLPTGIFLDKYHKFLQGDSAAQLDNWLRANYPSYAEAQRQPNRTSLCNTDFAEAAQSIRFFAVHRFVSATLPPRGRWLPPKRVRPRARAPR